MHWDGSFSMFSMNTPLEAGQPSASLVKTPVRFVHPLNERSNPGFTSLFVELGLRQTQVWVVGLQLGVAPVHCESWVQITQPPEKQNLAGSVHLLSMVPSATFCV